MSSLKDRKVTRRMTMRSLSAIGLLALLVAIGAVLFEQEIRVLESSARVVNLSGRQRMLSQRAALLAERLASPESPLERESTRRQLVDLIAVLERTHVGLLDGDTGLDLPAPGLSAIARVYDEPPHRLDRRMREYVGLLRQSAASEGSEGTVLSRISETALDSGFLDALDAVVEAFEADSLVRLGRLRRAQLFILLLILVGTLTTVFKILLPISRDVRQHLLYLRATQERFRQVADHIRDVFWLYDMPQRRMVYVSPAYDDVWGRNPRHLYGGLSNWTDAVHPADIERVTKAFRQVDENGGYEEVYRIVREDGAIRWVHDRAFAVRDAEGTLAQIAGLAEDVTEGRRADERLREQAAELHLTFENAPVGIATCDMQGRIETVNSAFCASLGYSQEELTGRNERDLTHPDDVARTMQVVGRASRWDQDVFTLQKRFLRSDGTPVSGLVRYGVVRATDGSPRRLIVQFEDWTERLSAEREIADQRERLAHVTRVAMMGEMAAGIAHEINQPLAAITTFADASRRLLEQEDRKTEVGGALAKIREQAHRAGEVIRRLRSLLKRRESTAEVTDANEIVGEAVDLAEADARVRDLHIETELAPGLPPVVVDRVQIQQVVLNLLRNSVEALEASGRTDMPIRISTRREGDEAVRVTISDRGPGLPMDGPARLFEPFYTTKASGLGMGLSISRSIVNSHGGELGCTELEGGGTAFHFTLPGAEADSAQRSSAG